MTALTLRGLFARKLRAGLTGLAVLLGVMMISGTYVFTDTINGSFDKIFEEGAKGTDVVVKSKQAFTTDSGTLPPSFPESVLSKVDTARGVSEAAGGVIDYASIFLPSGKQVKTQGAPPLLYSTLPRRFNPLDYVRGKGPRTDKQVAIDKGTADKENISVGERIKLVGKAPAQTYVVSGIAKYGDVSSLGNATIAVVTLREGQRIADKPDQLDQISIGDEKGFTAEQVVRSVQRALPTSVEAKTGQQDASDQAQDVKDSLGFLNTALLAFAGIALFVGGFIIFNTFSITVAQRTKEFALLRTMGASARQVLGSVVLEALLIGVIASAVGVAAGVLAAKGISALFNAFGIGLPEQGTVIETRTIVIAATVGVLVTLVSGLAPARRATRVPPLAAMREDAARQSGRAGHRREIVAAVALVLGFAIVLWGLFGASGSTQVLFTLAVGAIMVFIAVALLSARLVGPLASGVGRPLEGLRGMEGQLARENAMRNPSRTATTAAALMIGLALVTFVTVLAAGIKASVTETLDKSFTAELVLQNTQGSFNPIPEAAGTAVSRVRGVEVVSPLKSTNAKILTRDAGRTVLSGVEPSTITRVWNFDFKNGEAGTLSRLGNSQVVLNDQYATGKKLKVGNTIQVETSTSAKPDFTIVGTVDDKSGFFGKGIVTSSVMRTKFAETQNFFELIRTAPGANVAAVQASVDKVLETEYPTVESKNQTQFKNQIESQINQLLALLYALLSLSIIVSLFGIVNTLVLSITERTRELGMMRAIGTSRRQVRRIVRYESVITALIGGVLGLVVGLVLASLTTVALENEGFKLSIPVLQLVAFLVLAGIAGVLAAIPPARRASRIDVLEALAYE
ncbi:MAG: FtsX-like permease family protein [Solirubrobacterales bacterium]